MSFRKSVDILSHPIVLEFVKMYETICNFKGLVEKNMPANVNDLKMKETFKRLNEINTIHFDKKEKVTPHSWKSILVL